jgi:putative PIN family toxin of toxin-antitoxin system
MTFIVIDTNIFVSAAISPAGNPARIAALISKTTEIQVFYSAAILAEYKRVLSYERLNISAETQSAIIDSMIEFGILIEPPVSTIPLPDETDRIFYDTAKASGSILITGNIKHFPTEPFIITPADFVKAMKKQL